MRTRGFMMAATAGRTTLLGEGLQHQDGHSLVLASTVPAVQAYDPATNEIVSGTDRPGLTCCEDEYAAADGADPSSEADESPDSDESAAASPEARGLGALICFADQIHAGESCPAPEGGDRV